MQGFDVDKFGKHLQVNALPPFGQGKCARFVRLALEAGGAQIAGHPASAKDWGPVLLRAGFKTVTAAKIENYRPSSGDVAVIQGTSSRADGHIQGYDGSQWISDFVQSAFWPGPSYRNEKPDFKIYRP
jgi:hypothetical protein